MNEYTQYKSKAVSGNLILTRSLWYRGEEMLGILNNEGDVARKESKERRAT